MRKHSLIVGLVIIFTSLIIGGVLMFNKFNDKGLNQDSIIEKKIAKDFSSLFLTPEGNEVTELTFWKKPQDASDFTGNRMYYFYINNHKNWKVGVAVIKDTNEISAYGSDYIELNEKETSKKVDNLKINHWKE